MQTGQKSMKNNLFQIFGRYLILIILFVSAECLFSAETGTLKGRIIDTKTGNPLPGANIQILGTVRGGSANIDGEFIVENVNVGIYDIRISMISYKTVTKKRIQIQVSGTEELLVGLEETAIEFDPIVVLGGKTKQRLDQANVSISVITSREIERRNPVDLVQALEDAPGINFIGNQINIRGSTGFTFGAGNKVLLLLDGVPVYASDTGEFNWDMLPPLDIEQIEVLKGAGSTLWGASALGGVVNILTKSPSPEGQLKFSFSGGKYGYPKYSEWEWTDHDNLYYNRQDISYSKRTGQFGFRISGGRYVSTGYQQLGDFEKYNLTGKFDYRFKNSIKWTAYAAYSYIDRGFFIQWKSQNDPYEVDDAYSDNYFNTHQLNLYTKLNIPISTNLAVNLRGSFIRTLMGNQFGEGADFNPAFGQGFEVTTDWIPLEDHVVTAGVQYQHDSGDIQGHHKGYAIGPYVQDEWKVRENLRTTLGLRYDQYKLLGGKTESLFSPRLGVNWQPWESTSIRGSVGSGFRAATIVERFLELTVMNFKIKSNPDLEAEYAWAYDIGIRQYITPDWNIDISLFNNEYWNLIEAHLDLIRGEVQFRNIPRAHIRGIEATTNWSSSVFILGQNFDPSLQISTTLMDHKDKKYEEPLTYRPKQLVTMKGRLGWQSFDLEIIYRYASEIDAVKIYPINERVPMKFWDAQLSYSFKKFTLHAGVDNITNYNYAPMESNLMPPRTYTIGLKGGF